MPRGADPTSPATPASRFSAPRLSDYLLYGSLTAIGPLTIDMYLAGLPAIADDLGASDVSVQLTLTATMAGIAVGQLIIGAVSDVLGRKRPLVVALALYVIVSTWLTFSDTINVLLALRFLQGLTGAAGMVLSQAMVRDRFDGTVLAQFISRLMLVVGVAPVLAPWIGAQFLHFGTWRTMFFGLAAFGLVLTLAAVLLVKETLPPARRSRGGVPELLGSYRYLLTSRKFVGLLVTGSFIFGALFVYVSSAPFVYQGLFDLSPQDYALAFAAGAVSLTIGSQINGFLVRRVHPIRLLMMGLTICAIGSGFVILLSLVAPSLAATMVGVLILMLGVGLILPNNAVLALTDHPERAGAAAALLASANSTVGALVSPLSGLTESESPLPMGLLMLGCVCASAAGFFFLARPRQIVRLMPWPGDPDVRSAGAADPGFEDVFNDAVEEMLQVSRAYDAQIQSR